MIHHPYTELTGGNWMRGNLHAHTNLSDGSRSSQEVIDDYAARGYDFLMLSDHDQWMGQDALSQFENRGMILIPGNEITAEGPHILHVGGNGTIPPRPDRQAVFDDVQKSDGFAVANHPNWLAAFDHCRMDQMREWLGYAGLEIFNGVIGRCHGSPYSTAKWDMLLAEGRKLWGFANDDSHLPADVELGWNMTYVTEPTPEGVINALVSGRFYASTGVQIRNIQVQGKRIRLETENACRIVALINTGRRLAVADSPSIEVEFPEDAVYLRFECWGDGERFAWTQPFWNAP